MKDAKKIATLAPLACGGDREAVGQIVEMTRARLLAVACSALDNRDDALDAVASALVQICLNIGQVRDPARLEGWMQAIVRREAGRLRRARVDWLPLAEWQHPTHRLENQSQLRIDVERALRVLPAHQEQAMRLHYGQGLTAREIADRFGVAEGTVKMWLHRARKFLSGQLEGYETVPIMEENLPAAPQSAPAEKMSPFQRTMSRFTDPDARYAGILHDDLPADLMDALQAGLRAGGYVSVAATWQDLDNPGFNRATHNVREWAEKLSLLVIDEKIGGMSALVPLLFIKNSRFSVPVPTCLFYSLKLPLDEREALIVAGIGHFLRKDKPHSIANFARPFRRRSDGIGTTDAVVKMFEILEKKTAKYGEEQLVTADVLDALMRPEVGIRKGEPVPSLAVDALREGFGISSDVVRAALVPYLMSESSRDAKSSSLISEEGETLKKRTDEEVELLLDDFIGTEHLLLALISMTNAPAGQVLASLGVDLQTARAVVRRLRDLPAPIE